MKISKEQLECNLTVINTKFMFPLPGPKYSARTIL